MQSAVMAINKDKRPLFLVREMLDEARTIANGNYLADYSLLKTVWLADLATELTLATVVSDLDLGLGNQKNPMFEYYLAAINGANDHPEVNSLKLHFSSVHSLHKARNGIHNAVAISHTSSQKLVQTATHLIQTVFYRPLRFCYRELVPYQLIASRLTLRPVRER